MKICIAAGALILLAVIDYLFGFKAPPTLPLCPHGFVDWDECPVCRH